MNKKLCDKCGKEIFNDPQRQAKFPYISISRMDNLFDFKQVDLCDACIDKLISWLDKDDEKLKIGHCKDCKHFHCYHEIENMPNARIMAHNVCYRWGDKCYTKEDGYCYLFEPRESEEVCSE